MESEGAGIMFRRSRQWFEGKGAVYHKVIRDRDSDLMFKIRYVYEDLGLCETCKKFIGVPAANKTSKSFR